MDLHVSDIILHNSEQMIALVSKEGIFLHVNELFCSVSGYRPEELLGQNQEILASGYHDQSFFDAL